MTVTLRPYQQQGVDEIRDAFKAHRSVLYVAPCGSGKTRLFSSIAAGAASKGRRILICSHRDFLHRQICDALTDAGVQHGVMTGGIKYTTRQPVVVASVFTLVKRLEHFPAPDLIICDESHHFAVGNTWSKVFAAYPKARILGVTASPIRSSGEGLGDLFEAMVLGPTVAELMSEGFLSNYTLFTTPNQVDLRGLKTRGGDYITGELETVMDRPKVTGDMVAHYRKLAPGKAAVVGCVSIKHAEDVAAQFRDDGWQFTVVHGKQDEFEQRKIFDSFARGELHGLTFCSLISEGYDLPRLEVYIGARPTKSLAIKIQHEGRVLRPFAGKDRAIILDHAGNTYIHGYPDDDHDWQLTKTLDRKFKSTAPAVRTCPACFAMHRPMPRCPVCDHLYDTTGRTVDHVDGELVATVGHDPDPLAELERRFSILRKVAIRRGREDPTQWALSVVAGELARQRAKTASVMSAAGPMVNGLAVGDYDELKERVMRAMSREDEVRSAQAEMEV